MMMAADSTASENSHNNDIPASPPRTTSERTAKPGRQPSTTQAGFRAIRGEASPRRTGMSNCSVCDTKFTIFEHRHICQKCQEPVCNRCSRSRKVFRAGTRPKRVCDNCVQTFPSATKIVSDMSNTIESGNRSRLTLPASEATDTCAERTMLSPSPATSFFGIGMGGMPSPPRLPPPTPAGGDDSAPTPLATAFARFRVEAKAVFGGRRASGDIVENKKPEIPTAAATKVKTPPSSSSPPPAQQQDRMQGDMELVTNGDQGQAGSGDKGPDFNSAMSAADVVPAVAAAEMQEDAEASHAQVTNEAADTFDRAVLGLDVSHFSSTAACTPTNYFTAAAAAPDYHKIDMQISVHSEVSDGDVVPLCPHETNEGDTVDGAPVEFKITAAETTAGANPTPFLAALGPSIAAPASHSTTASQSQQDQEVVRNEVAVKGTDGSQPEETGKTDIVNGAELKAAEIDVSINTTVDILAGAIPSTGMPAFAAPELSPEEASETSGTVQTNAVDGTSPPAPEEHHTEKDSETAAANSALTSSKKSGARLIWMHFTIEVWGCLAAVFMGLAVGLLLLVRD